MTESLMRSYYRCYGREFLRTAVSSSDAFITIGIIIFNLGVVIIRFILIYDKNTFTASFVDK